MLFSISLPLQFVLETRLDLSHLTMIKQHLIINDTPMVDRLTESLRHNSFGAHSTIRRKIKVDIGTSFLPSSSILVHYLVLLTHSLFENILVPVLLIATFSVSILIQAFFSSSSRFHLIMKTGRSGLRLL